MPVSPLTPLTVYQIAVSALSLLSLGIALDNVRQFRRPDATEPFGGGGLPSLSVLIPARNEAESIAACIRSLREQAYPGEWEIVVLDDSSEDGTGDVALAAADGDSRVRVLRGGALEPGWKGKPNALRQLLPAARGELLLLTDADCVFAPGALAAAARYRARTGADCLSLIPNLRCGSFWEHVVIPLQYDVVFLTLPIRKVAGSANPAFAAANGAFLLLLAQTYRDLGGPAAVRNEMAEDIHFAQHVKRSGRRLVYGDGSRTYRVRMYTSLREIWDGFSKNLFPAMGNRPAILLAWSGFHLATQVLPFGFVAVGLLTGRTRSWGVFLLPLLQAAIALGIRLALTIRFRQALWAVWTHPLGWLVTLAIGANSAFLSLSGRGHSWKGRVYQ